jgi:hypothetical protein
MTVWWVTITKGNLASWSKSVNQRLQEEVLVEESILPLAKRLPKVKEIVL